MSTETPQVPIDDAALDAIEHALGGGYELVDGEHVLRGADYTLDQLLGFWAGIDSNERGEYVGHGDPMGLGIDAPMYETPGVYLNERDVIRALIHEVRRLREARG